MSSDVEELQQTLHQLQSGSRVSISLIILGALALIGSVIYAATRLEPLERKIVEKQQQLTHLENNIAQQSVIDTQLQQSIAIAEQQLAQLRTNIEQLYAVRVTDENQVFELKATAKATGRNTHLGPEYDFNVFINAPVAALQNIQQVNYQFAHATIRQQHKTATEQQQQFSVGYRGWGCLTQVSATVTHLSGEQTVLDFNMCRSLGPQWVGSDCRPPSTETQKVSKLDMAREDCAIEWR